MSFTDLCLGNIPQQTSPIAVPTELQSSLAPDSEMLEHRQQVLYALRERLKVLEIRAAKTGIETPPHITVEIKQLGEQIAAIEQSLRL